MDVNELVEIRARQRTFNGAYSRSAIGNLSYSLAVLRLFDHRFYKSKQEPNHLSPATCTNAHNVKSSVPLTRIDPLVPYLAVGILYAVLAGFLFLISFLRARHSRHDFADRYEDANSDRPPPLKTKGQEAARIFGRPFVTAGWTVVAVSALVAAVEICLLLLILYL